MAGLFNFGTSESFFNDIIQPCGVDKFPVLKFDELRLIAAEIDDRDEFRATQYDEYRSRNLMIPFKRGDAKANISSYRDISPLDTSKILLLLDQRINRKLVDVLLVEKIQDMGFDEIKRFRDPFAYGRSLDTFWSTRVLAELNVLLSQYKQRDLVFVDPICSTVLTFGENTGGSNFHPLMKFDNKEEKNVGIFVFYRNMDPVNGLRLAEHIKEGHDVIVCSDSYMYNSCFELNRSPMCQGYQIATNIKDYAYYRGIEFVESKGYEFLNPDIISKFRRFSFSGTETLSHFNFLRLLDRNKVLEYSVIGFHTKFLPECDYNNPDPILFFVSGRSEDVLINVRPQDSVYHTKLKREMSQVYLSKILPVMGLVDKNLLERFGFIKPISYLEGAVSCGHAIQSVLRVFDLEIGLPYIIKEPHAFQYFYPSGNFEETGFYSIDHFCDGWYIVVFSKIGRVMFNANCSHPGYNLNMVTHKHNCQIKTKVDYNYDVVLKMEGAESRLLSLPRLFRVDSLRKNMGRISGQSLVALDQFIVGLSYDIRLIVLHNWVFNPLGRSFMYIEDVALDVDFSEVFHNILFRIRLGHLWIDEIKIDPSLLVEVDGSVCLRYYNYLEIYKDAKIQVLSAYVKDGLLFLYDKNNRRLGFSLIFLSQVVIEN